MEKTGRKGASAFIATVLALVCALALAIVAAPLVASADEEEETTYVCYNQSTFEYYTSLQDAIDEATTGAVIVLTDDVEVDSTISINGKIVILQLAGKSISASSSFSGDSLIKVINGATAYINTGTISGSCTNLIYVTGTNSTLTLNNVTLDGNSSATRGIYVYGKGASASVNSSTIQNVQYGIDTYKCNPSDDTTSGITSVYNSTISASYCGIQLYMSKCQSISSSIITGGTHGIIVRSNVGDSGYYTELTATSSTITGTSSYAIYMAEANWGSGSGTLKLNLTGCTLSGAGNIGIYAHSYVASLLGDDYSVSYDSDTNITCSKNLGNWTAYYTEHSYEAVVTAPTCTEQGYTTYTCSVCGDSYVDDYTEATGHSYVVTETVDATCEEDGYIVYTCENDETHTYTETISATGHTWAEPDADDAVWAEDYSSCTLTLTCSVCGATTTIELSVTSSVDGDVTTYVATGVYGGKTYTVTATVTASSDDEEATEEETTEEETTEESTDESASILADTGDSTATTAAVAFVATLAAAFVAAGATLRRRVTK